MNMEYCKKALTIEGGQYYIDGVRGSDVRLEEPFQYENHLYLNLTSTRGMDGERLADTVTSLNGVDLFTILISDPAFSVETDLTFPTNSKYYSWFCFAVPKPKIAAATPVLPSPLRMEIVETLDTATVALLTERWERDYVEAVLGGYPDSIKEVARKSFAGGINKEKSHHALFYKGDDLVGHLMLDTAYFPPLGGNSTAVHFWVDSTLPSADRRAIHESLWHQIHFSFSEDPRFAGVARINSKSVNYLLHNGAYPLHLRVKKIEESK
ncbi:MAG: hypothetical protein H6617_05010 [Bdellovibrionaceae bacterium]|nr:hypothetical protein [Pseudobdellovibrionaceae bacterium]